MKAYVKPELFYERYELSQHIANCDIEFQNSLDVSNCYGLADPGLSYDGFQLFINPDYCTTIFEEYCATNGGDGFLTTFIS